MKKENVLSWIIVILTGSIFGNIIGSAFSKYLPLLKFGESIGFSPVTFDLSIITFTIGFSGTLTLSAIIGILLAILVYKKLIK